jgi:hypothetical protein
MTETVEWRTAFSALVIAIVLTVLLTLVRERAGFPVHNMADLAAPALLYFACRFSPLSRGRKRQATLIERTIGVTPEVAALSLFAASALVEIYQFAWPTGIFSGQFDPLDILAYATSVGVCYALDQLALHRQAAVES